MFLAAVLAAVVLLACPSLVRGQPVEDAVDEDTGGADYAAGELVVTYEQEAPVAAVESLPAEVEAVPEEEIPEIDAELLAFPEVKSLPSGEAREAALAQIKEELERDPAVESVEYNYIRRASFIPNDPSFEKQWGPKKIRAPRAWNTTRGSADVDVGVVDSGIDGDHLDLQAKISLQRDFVNNDAVADDQDGHGTHVAGVAAAATNNGRGIAGICPDCELLIARSLNANGVGTDVQVAEGIIWGTDKGAEVINLSLGGPQGTTTLKRAVNYAWNRGVVVVAAAGSSGNAVGYPAAYANVMAVASTNQNDKRARFSNYGYQLDVAAPGVDILSTYLGGRYMHLSGTSMASPHVAGLAGLLAAQGRLPAQIRGIIESTATNGGAAGWDRYYGWGRINAAAATSCTIVGTPGPEDISGTAGRDVICALGGNDRIRGGDSNDAIWAGPGDDVVGAGAGNDTIIGGAGKDRMYGAPGSDRLNGGDGVEGNDTLSGGADRDSCRGDARDRLRSCP